MIFKISLGVIEPSDIEVPALTKSFSWTRIWFDNLTKYFLISPNLDSTMISLFPLLIFPKETTPSILKERNKTQEILKLAVKRMLPGGPLAKKQLTKLKIYNGENHPHDIQKPKVIEFNKLNKRNLVKN